MKSNTGLVFLVSQIWVSPQNFYNECKRYPFYKFRIVLVTAERPWFQWLMLVIWQNGAGGGRNVITCWAALSVETPPLWMQQFPTSSSLKSRPMWRQRLDKVITRSLIQQDCISMRWGRGSRCPSQPFGMESPQGLFKSMFLYYSLNKGPLWTGRTWAEWPSH